MPRQILHIDMDAFFVSVEEMFNPKLKGKAVIVGGDPDSRGVVSAASYEARKFGIHSAMPLSKAKKLCPDAIFLHGNYDKYCEVSDKIFSILNNYTPDIEITSVDESYLDLTGFERLYGPTIAAAEKIKLEIRQKIGINASIGISTNKLVAKVASECAKPNGILMILPGYEKEFLAPLSIERLPGVGKSTRERFISLGIKTIGTLAQLDEELLIKTFGKWGSLLHQKANGIDPSAIQTRYLPKSISHEKTFDQDIIDRQLIFSTLFHLVERTAKSLREQRLQTKCITLKLRYSDFSTITRSRTIPEPTDFDKIIYKNIIEIFEKAYARKRRIRLLGVALSHFTSNAWQQKLFDQIDTEKLKSFYKTIDKIRDKYGFDALKIIKKSEQR